MGTLRQEEKEEGRLLRRRPPRLVLAAAGTTVMGAPPDDEEGDAHWRALTGGHRRGPVSWGTGPPFRVLPAATGDPSTAGRATPAPGRDGGFCPPQISNIFVPQVGGVVDRRVID